MTLSLGQKHSIGTCCDSCFNKKSKLQSSSNQKIPSTLLSIEETSQTLTKRSREDFEVNKKEERRYLIATQFPSLSANMTLTANKVSTPSLSMQELIRQRVGLSKSQPETTVVDYLEEDEEDEEKNETHHVCKCCRKCEEFVPKRTPISKGPNLSNNNNNRNRNNNTFKGRFNAKRKLQNSQEEDEEEEDSPTGTICANCGCTLIHHLVDDWEAENDARDEDYLAEYGEYDD
jgi:ribosomal protein L32